MNMNATILGGHRVCSLRMVLHEYVWPPLMAAIEKRQKEISDGWLLQNALRKIWTLQANATDQLKKAKAEAQVIIEQANKRRSQIWTKLKLKQNRNAPKSCTGAG